MRNKYDVFCSLKYESINESHPICKYFSQIKVKITKKEAKAIRNIIKYLNFHRVFSVTELSDFYILNFEWFENVKEAKNIIKKMAKMGLIKNCPPVKTLAGFRDTFYKKY